jgi:hypothetical protein
MEMLKELQTVALLQDIPSKKLKRGDVGAIVNVLSDTKVEVEFVDNSGRTTALEVLKKSDLIQLRLELKRS